MKKLAAMLAALAVGGCSVSADVVGKVGPEGKAYHGLATGYMDRTGTIDMTSADGSKCVGEFRYTGSKTGRGNLRCNDGRTAVIQFNALGMASGYGYGTANDGSPVAFTYGLSPQESEAYLSTPPQRAQRKETAPSKSSKRAYSGTGFFINAQGHILTNEHVVEGCKTILVRQSDGAKVPAHVVAADELNDLAVIRTGTPAPAFATFARSSTYRQGDQVVAYGFPLSAALSASGNLTTGSLTALSGLGNDSRYVQISAPVQVGNSGGPLSDMRGNIIGVVAAKLNAIRVAEITGDLPQNVNFAVKDIVAKAFLQAHGIKHSERKAAPILSTADVGDVLRRAVVFIVCEAG